MRRFTIWIVAAGILAPLNGTQESPSLPDSRVLRVDAFFDSYGCSSPNYAGEYVKAADLYDLDFRILPAISLLESTCGAYQRYNNHWGWNSARTGFPSVPEGIHHIARELALGESYRQRDLERKLFTYNPRLEYVRAATALMQKIDPSGGSAHEAPFR